jgi:hypothetical protein
VNAISVVALPIKQMLWKVVGIVPTPLVRVLSSLQVAAHQVLRANTGDLHAPRATVRHGLDIHVMLFGVVYVQGPITQMEHHSIIPHWENSALQHASGVQVTTVVVSLIQTNAWLSTGMLRPMISLPRLLAIWTVFVLDVAQRVGTTRSATDVRSVAVDAEKPQSSTRTTWFVA